MPCCLIHTTWPRTRSWPNITRKSISPRKRPNTRNWRRRVLLHRALQGTYMKSYFPVRCKIPSPSLAVGAVLVGILALGTVSCQGPGQDPPKDSDSPNEVSGPDFFAEVTDKSPDLKK